MSVAHRSRRGTLGFTIALLLLGLVAFENFVTTRALVATTVLVEESHDVIENLRELRGALARTESARRAHGLTRDAADIVTYEQAREHLRDTLAKARALNEDDAEQRRRLGEVEPLLQHRIAMFEATIEASRAPTADPEGEKRRTREGTVTSRAIASRIDEMIDAEERILAMREQKTRESVRFTRLVQVTGTLFSFGILFVGFRGLRREVAARTRSERALRASEENAVTTLRSIGDGVIATDVDGRVTRMNLVAETLTGWTLAEAKGKSFAEVFRIVHEKTREPAVDPVAEVLAKGMTIALATHTALVAKDGAERPIADSAAPIRDAEGVVAGAVLVFRDMTAEREAQDKLEDAHRFLYSIVENIPNMVFVKSASDLRYERMNRAGVELLGTTREALLGKSDFELYPREDAEQYAAKDREVLAGTSAVVIAEEPILTRSGRRRWLRTRKIAILDSDERPRHLLGISEDITEAKEMADLLRQAHDDLERKVIERTAELRAKDEQLRQAQKMEAIGRLAGGVAHDFNNMLSVILSYASLLTDQFAEGTPVHADLVEIGRAGERATELTRQLLAFSRQQVLDVRFVDLNEVVAGVRTMLGRMIGEDVEIRVVDGPQLDDVRVDPGQMDQILMNLVVNARDAMPRGGTITIETANVELCAEHAARHENVTPGPHVMLAVTDTGTGMDEATQQRIFEPFFTTKELGKGTGLGLATVFGIVKQSGGHISVQSELGKGTTFTAYFPRATGAPEAESLTPQSSTSSRGAETVLLVEDDDQVRNLARLILERSGYRVIDAPNGYEALLSYERLASTVHIVVTDLVMPKLGGRELAERLTALHPGLKVLVMSGYTDDVVMRNGALDAGFAFLQKPFTPQVLTAKVREVLDGAHAGS
jgi:PAS domain S-box-containing protein